MRRLDSLHVPGGDGGPGYFTDDWFDAVHQVALVVKARHPRATVTLSANSFNASSFARFLDALAKPGTAEWLDGLQLGKEEPLPLAAFIARVHAINPKLTILRIPDITHTVETGFAVPAWSYTWSSTHGREAINPAPLRFEAIMKLRRNGSYPTIGCARPAAAALAPAMQAPTLLDRRRRRLRPRRTASAGSFGLRLVVAVQPGGFAGCPRCKRLDFQLARSDRLFLVLLVV